MAVECVTGNDFVFIAHKVLEHHKFFKGKVDYFSGSGYYMACGVEYNIAECKAGVM
jgi:hypothetical protein